ncbi:MAG: hypothetical protein HC854_14390 [Flavobacterium sp.]|nr:hypothetical protein [Flavobacterium sp.]
MSKTIRLTDEAKDGLDWLKEAYNFTNFSIAVETCSLFFKNNKVNPRDLLSENFSQTLLEFKKEMIHSFEKVIENNNDNIERVIKIERRFEIDYFKPSNIKLIDIHKSNVQSSNDKSNNEIINSLKDTSKELLDLNSKIKILESDNKLKDDLIKSLETEKLEYHRCLKKLNESMRVEKFENSNRPYINLTVSEAEELFYLIP